MDDEASRLSDEFTPIWWNVVFLPRDFRSWWDIFSPRWCRHVLAYGYVPHSDRWLVVDPQENRTIVAAMTDAQLDAHLELWLGQDPYIVRIKSGDGSRYANRALQTCSSVIAQTIGLDRSAWRPALLMQRLRDLNAEIRRTPNELQGQGPRGRPGNESAA